MTRLADAVRGGIGFLTRLPAGHDEAAWDAFRRAPVVFPLVAYPTGLVVALPFLAVAAVGSPVTAAPTLAPLLALALPVAVYAVTGINHLDGVADLGDAAVVHGDSDRRRAVLRDTALGVGGTVALALVVAGLALAGLALAGVALARGAPLAAVGIVVAAEVGAKTGVALQVALGEATHEGLGSQLTSESRPRGAALPLAAALPALGLTGPSPAALVAVAGALVVALAVLAWARGRLGGVSGDVFGATAELARVVGLGCGVAVWTLAPGDLAAVTLTATAPASLEVIAWTPS